MLQNTTCRQLCTTKVIPPEDGKFINDRIREDYALNWLVDGLPAAEMKLDTKSSQVFYDMGFELGNDDEERFSSMPALNNHLEIVMRFGCPSCKQHRINLQLGTTHGKTTNIALWESLCGPQGLSMLPLVVLTLHKVHFKLCSNP